eukprot:8915422-Pyramimonas_sp.AAC.1
MPLVFFTFIRGLRRAWRLHLTDTSPPRAGSGTLHFYSGSEASLAYTLDRYFPSLRWFWYSSLVFGV